MAFFLQGWGKVETSANCEIYTLQGIAAAPPQIPHAIPPITIGSFRQYNYYADRVATNFDPIENIILPGYFDTVMGDLQVGDIIYLYSAAPDDLDRRARTTIVSAVNTSTPYVEIELVNVGIGQVTTEQFADAGILYLDIQNVSAERLLGNAQIFEGVVEEIELGNGLEFVADTLEVSQTLLNHVSGTITAAEWNNMFDTPIRLVQNLSINALIVIEKVLFRQLFVGDQYTGGGSVVIGYGDAPGGLEEPAATTIDAATINNINATSSLSVGEITGPIFEQVATGQDIYISNQDAVFATGTGDWEYNVWYKII